MGKDVSPVAFTREERVRYRQKVRRCLDVFALMLDDFGFDADRPTTGLEIELNLVDGEAEPAMRNAEILANLADPTFQTELGQFNLELNARPRLIEGAGFARLRATTSGPAWRAPSDRAVKADATIVLIGILPTLTPRHLVLDNLSSNERYRVLNEQIVDARGEDIGAGHPGRGAAAHVDRLDRPRGRLHQRAVPPPGGAGHVRQLLERLPGRSPAVQVAVGANSPFLLRPAALGRDPDRPVRAGHRHPAGRAQGPGGTPTRVVRRALDHLDLRPVRGERAVLPAAAADLRRRGPGGGAAQRRGAAARRAAAAQRHRLPLEPAGVRHHERPPAPARREPGAAGRADRRRHARQRRVLLRAGPRDRRGRPSDLDTADVHRGRGELPHRRPTRDRRRRSTGRGWARSG